MSLLNFEDALRDLARVRIRVRLGLGLGFGPELRSGAMLWFG